MIRKGVSRQSVTKDTPLGTPIILSTLVLPEGEKDWVRIETRTTFKGENPLSYTDDIADALTTRAQYTVTPEKGEVASGEEWKEHKGHWQKPKRRSK